MPASSPTLPNGAARVAALELRAAVQRVTPTTGQTVVSDGSGTLAIDPTGALLALTVTMPTPTDGMRITIASSQAITTLTIGGATIVGTVTTLALGGFATFVYVSGATAWFRAA